MIKPLDGAGNFEMKEAMISEDTYESSQSVGMCSEDDDLKLMALIGFAISADGDVQESEELYREFLKKVEGCD